MLVADNFDMLIIPGGWVFDFETDLTPLGEQKINEFVKNGGGYLGICAGAFFASGDGYPNARIEKKIIGGRAGIVWGTGKVHVTFTDKGREIFDLQVPESEQWSMYFANGALFKMEEGCTNCILDIPITQYDSLITYKSFKGRNIVPNHPVIEGVELVSDNFHDFPSAAICGEFGEGRVICFGPHPELSGPSFIDIIVQSIQWICKLGDIGCT
eukprot:TRINITY_DN1588_c0_g1_i2.p1 TRINITY_DN1588_c0_g1~~TRINITY_DN1588_c0_g1_i2.p1  ORF type:complete len:213 (-),score=51.84 TRINITY_DN1588_c0_g1_i2:79-717(-)